MINLELPKKLRASANQAHQVAAQILRPVSRKYDLAEHEYPKELDTMRPWSGPQRLRAGRVRRPHWAAVTSSPRLWATPTAATWRR